MKKTRKKRKKSGKKCTVGAERAEQVCSVHAYRSMHQPSRIGRCERLGCRSARARLYCRGSSREGKVHGRWILHEGEEGALDLSRVVERVFRLGFNPTAWKVSLCVLDSPCAGGIAFV